ncbi:MAG: 4Fe-4S dicluster domain-containing protein [Ruminococcaceae bacterium]|nr:4Fe-4S dicluster domain-containing protein [Oscillospiraceae bacterium]
MIYNKVCNDNLSILGYGMMRLPTLENGKIDEAQVADLVDTAIKNGVNYFDTAWPYHGGESEIVTARVLKKYPRESYRLASKYPGHQIFDSYNPAEIFEEQLKKCDVEYFDYYLLHNIYEKSVNVYMDERWGILDYFREQKRLGRIKHLGFSTHGSLETIKTFLDYCGEDMEFCQIQLNYLDWTLQSAKEKYELLTEKGIPVWVMEPVRGGRLLKLPESVLEELKNRRPDESIAAWAFRFLQELPNVKMILSGMSNMEQLTDNIKTLSENKPLKVDERELLFNIAEGMKNSIPCTACGYCVEGCPMGLNIPMLMSVYNEIRFSPITNVAMRIEALPEEKQPSSCISCGKCTSICPQNIDIPKHLADLAEALKKIPSWADICRERAEAAAKLKNK